MTPRDNEFDLQQVSKGDAAEKQLRHSFGKSSIETEVNRRATLSSYASLIDSLYNSLHGIRSLFFNQARKLSAQRQNAPLSWGPRVWSLVQAAAVTEPVSNCSLGMSVLATGAGGGGRPGCQ
jgi:hypothetical protein